MNIKKGMSFPREHWALFQVDYADLKLEQRNLDKTGKVCNKYRGGPLELHINMNRCKHFLFLFSHFLFLFCSLF